jgi:hypothetical protein
MDTYTIDNDITDTQLMNALDTLESVLYWRTHPNYASWEDNEVPVSRLGTATTKNLHNLVYEAWKLISNELQVIQDLDKANANW